MVEINMILLYNWLGYSWQPGVAHIQYLYVILAYISAPIPLNKCKPSGQNVVTLFMDHNIYLLATDPKNACRDVIHSRDTGLKVRVFCLDNEQFTAEDEEIQLYGYAGKKLYAFETINIAAEDALDVVSAIQWYADYIGFPKMEILPEDPREAGDSQNTIVKGLDRK